MKVAVLMGGNSFEREFSLASGKNICAALEEAGHKVVPLDTNDALVPTLRSERPDVVYNALHGKHGEDGTIQSLLEFLGLPFVGSPASVCHRTWNKDSLHSSLAKYRDITGEEGVASWPQGVYIARDAFKSMGAATALDLVGERVIGGYPVCVKPAHGGSALGVHRVDNPDDLGEAVLDALSYDDAVNIEQWVEGVELSVAILGTGWDAHALPPVEIVAREGFFDAEARMHEDRVEFFCPVRMASLAADESDAQAIRAEIERAALEVYRSYGVRDLGRVDMIWDGSQARCFELDVSPGMTDHSLFPVACRAAGLTLTGVVDALVTAAEGRTAF
ncbi:D-alanine--D-alanine ligase [Enterorhabdus sp. P55]|uniref:D-alanine--D-alanine ligase family protein n=1 Tax=Enterorhabdus sp. P55 TaxID=2304571 RepID=UPI001368E244|nr:D-alanine--D-alanine ligase [Eggerthellaceae bacterium]NBI32431.1 D-alanine--D-alanine ligase [Enterorhabdus sp. P55]